MNKIAKKMIVNKYIICKTNKDSDNYDKLIYANRDVENIGKNSKNMPFF